MLMATTAVVAPAHAGEKGAATAAAPKGGDASSEAKAKMAKLRALHGTWRGEASGVDRHRKPYKITQTERVGPLLDGEILLVEGRGYSADGNTQFNAFAVMSWNPRTQKYEFRSYTDGMSGTFEANVTENGFVWETPAGPDAKMVFTATIKDGRWHEVGEYIAKGRPPMKVFEMNLTRVGDTDWPQGTAVPPK